MALGLSGLLFALFAVNVMMGSFANASFMGDVSEALVLFGSALCFVAATLKREADEKNNQKD